MLVTIAFVARISQAMTPVKWPSPQPRATYSRRPPADGYRAPSFAKEYPCNSATPPAIANESQTAAPASSPAAPSSEKMPAPTIAPTPMNAACRIESDGGGGDGGGVDAATDSGPTGSIADMSLSSPQNRYVFRLWVRRAKTT